jgi:hypothetical protein
MILTGQVGRFQITVASFFKVFHALEVAGDLDRRDAPMLEAERDYSRTRCRSRMLSKTETITKLCSRTTTSVSLVATRIKCPASPHITLCQGADQQVFQNGPIYDRVSGVLCILGGIYHE